MIYRILNRASAFPARPERISFFLKRLEILCIYEYHYRKVENTNLILILPKSTPFLPPTEASTIDSSVVGTLMKSTPRLKVDATKPPKSVTTPPPRLIIRLSCQRQAL
jgi:hypothetical protein